MEPLVFYPGEPKEYTFAEIIAKLNALIAAVEAVEGRVTALEPVTP